MLNNTIARSRSVTKQGKQFVLRALAARQARSIPLTGAPRDRLTQAVQRSLLALPSAEEREWFDRIEAQRRVLNRSVRPLRFEDFGAGKDAVAPAPGGGAEAKAWREMTVGEMARVSSSSSHQGSMLFRLVRRLRPAQVLELGTCFGIASCYIAAALEMNGSGHLTTLEGGTEIADRARATLADVGVSERVTVVTGPFSETLESALQACGQVDLAFVDGHHQEQPTLDYTAQIRRHAAPNAVFAFDDIHWSAGMERAWKQLVDSGDFSLALDMGGIGFAMRDQQAHSKAELVTFPYI